MTMPGDDHLDDKQWNRLLQNVARHFDDLTIKRGFQYYKQGRVRSFAANAGRSLEAVVEGSEAYRVRVDPNALSGSECGCPLSRPCKHMIAVLMAYAERQGRSVHALANARTTYMQEAEGFVRSAPSAGKRREAEMAEQAALLPESDISKWHEWFALCTEALTDSTRNPQYAAEALSAIRRAKPAMSPAADKLFELNALFFLMHKLTSVPFMGYFTNIAAAGVKDAIGQFIAEPPPPASEPGQWPRLLETAALLRRRMMADTAGASMFADAYCDLWLNWISPGVQDQELYREELRRLQAAEDGTANPHARKSLVVGQSWMRFYLSEDREAWALLSSVKNQLLPGDVFRFINRLIAAEDWPRLVEWLAESAAALIGYRYDTMDEYGRYWDAAVRHLPAAEERMWQSIASLLPQSGQIYEDKLREYGRWRQWMDFQLSVGSDPLNFRASELQSMEKEAPETLLPFYHQAVERYVLVKNRDGYKQAVRLLKRLAKLYKKIKQEERWERFFASFVGRHSRLRALQEELRKGKLIL
ncbi:SWIM zinc finger family protein [Cohnella thermotolerans]|uniref:SWIM zinc finger family protein n=1 Tax=Cohnella thermotolerans TaxID=329858 RepID=UPI00041BB865|nr:SWIM zinc finger family protein [Cohnella thermotolerans]